MLPLKGRLEALGLVLFVDVDGRLDGSPTFPEALDKGVRQAKAVLGCWSPWALQREWVKNECAIARDQNKLVAVERLRLTPDDVPAEFYRVDRKDVTDLIEDQPHEGWGMALSALAAKLRIWADRNRDPAEADAAREKADVLDKAGLAERTAAGAMARMARGDISSKPKIDIGAAYETAWAAIDASLEAGHYRRYEKMFEASPAAFARLIEAEARAKSLDRWTGVDKTDPDAIADAIRTGLFPALEAEARKRMRRAADARLKEQQARAAAAAEASRQAEEEVRLESEKRAAEERRLGASVVRARDAALGGGAVSGRIFSLDLPGVPGWPRPEAVVIPPGRFLMGSPSDEVDRLDSEGPQREVDIRYPFAVGRDSVTFAEWDAAVAAGAKLSAPADEGWGRGARPVINVSWEDAKAYLAWLNEGLGLRGRTDAWRLLSEAEWEYSARAGTTTPFSFGATISASQANYDGNHTYGNGSKGEYRQKTTPVGTFVANAFGLHDMHGNVWEWVEDCYANNYSEGQPSDGRAHSPDSCANRVFRGGSWDITPRSLRSALRGWNSPTYRLSGIGFRVARTLPSTP